jgi:hypothetical protein
MHTVRYINLQHVRKFIYLYTQISLMGTQGHDPKWPIANMQGYANFHFRTRYTFLH